MLSIQEVRTEISRGRYGTNVNYASTTGISDYDYAANFNDFLKSWDKSKPFCFWYGALEPHRGLNMNLLSVLEEYQ
jgi:hypothetical protein